METIPTKLQYYCFRRQNLHQNSDKPIDSNLAIHQNDKIKEF